MKHLIYPFIASILLIFLFQCNALTKKDTKAERLKKLALVLHNVYHEDQNGRLLLDSFSKKYRYKSVKVESLWKDINKKDKQNLVIVSRILDSCGWLSPMEVGYDEAGALFFVIQHSNLTTMQKYLPSFRNAVKEGKANKKHLAMLEDRLLTFQGKKQIYGTQISINTQTGKSSFHPIEDIEHVNEKRKAMELEPIEAYASRTGAELPK